MTALVDAPTYRRLTGDSMDPTDALDEAQGIVEDRTFRTLTYGEHTDLKLRIYSDGKVYPSATPIAAVSSPAIGTDSIQGYAVFVGYFWPNPIVNTGYWNTPIPPEVDLTYTGGYHPVGTADADIVTEIIPVSLQRLICRIAYNILHPSTLAGVPAGATSVHVGDVGYSGKTLRGLDPVTDDIARALRGWRHSSLLGRR